MHVKTKLGNIWVNFFCSQLNQHLVYALGDLRNLKFADIAIFEHSKKVCKFPRAFVTTGQILKLFWFSER